MKKNIIKLSHFNSLAAQASQDITKKMADVASATGDVIRDLAAQIVMTGSSIAIIADNTEPEDDNAYWFYITDSVVNLKSPKKNNSRDTVYFATHVNHVEGLEEKFNTYALKNFIGADVNLGGSSGNVPAPNAGDQEKFLRGDGAWSNPIFVLSTVPSYSEGAIWLDDNKI